MIAGEVPQPWPDELLSGRAPLKVAGISVGAITNSGPADESDAARDWSPVPNWPTVGTLRRLVLGEAISELVSLRPRPARRGRCSGSAQPGRCAAYR